jgi:hypothetical protein
LFSDVFVFSLPCPKPIGVSPVFQLPSLNVVFIQELLLNPAATS